MKIRKRDARVQKWNVKKIEQAIKQAAVDAEETIEGVEALLEKVEGKAAKCVNEKDVVDVEVVHKCVEDVLMASKYKATARQYIEYRIEREKERSLRSDFIQKVSGLLNQTDEEVLNENANKSSRIVATHRDLLAGLLSKDFAKYILPKAVQDAEAIGKVWVHDRDYLISGALTNCGVYDYEGMLRDGFTLGNAKIESPNSVGVATTILSQIASTISSSSYGGQSIHRYTEMLKPYVLKSLDKLKQEQKEYNLPDEWVDKKIRKEVYDAHQTFLYQITPYLVAMVKALFVLSIYSSQDPIVKMIAEEYFKCHMAGLGSEGRTSVFPKVLYYLERGVNLDKN